MTSSQASQIINMLSTICGLLDSTHGAIQTIKQDFSSFLSLFNVWIEFMALGIGIGIGVCLFQIFIKRL